MTRNVAGAAYDRAIVARAPDRQARAAFRDLVVRLAPRGAALFDFGAGTGIDTRFYCERGFTVAGYDIDPVMTEYFADQCKDLIDAGRASIERGTYAEFLAREARYGAHLITSNFAPLNLVGELPPLFEKFNRLSCRAGMVLASVLNPYFRGDLRYGWWWRNAWRLWRRGQYAVPGAQAPIVRRRLACYAQLCRPHFQLERVYVGLPPRKRAQGRGVDVSKGVQRAWLRTTRSQFIFLLFRKRAES